MLTIVVAASTRGVIGSRGEIPWYFAEDMKHFRAVTMGHAVIMGRKTWDSLDGPLRRRSNIVVSRRSGFSPYGAEAARSLEEAIAIARTSDANPCVIGGAEIYALAMPMATTILLTEVHRDVDGDAFVHIDRSDFRETARRAGIDPAISFVTLERAR